MEPRRGSIWQRSDLGSLGRCQGGGLLYRRWKVDGEGCAFVGAAFDLEHAAVAIDDVLDDRESQAGAAEAARPPAVDAVEPLGEARDMLRSEEHTSELQSLMRISYAVFCLKKKNTH